MAQNLKTVGFTAKCKSCGKSWKWPNNYTYHQTSKYGCPDCKNVYPKFEPKYVSEGVWRILKHYLTYRKQYLIMGKNIPVVKTTLVRMLVDDIDGQGNTGYLPKEFPSRKLADPYIQQKLL